MLLSKILVIAFGSFHLYYFLLTLQSFLQLKSQSSEIHTRVKVSFNYFTILSDLNIFFYELAILDDFLDDKIPEHIDHQDDQESKHVHKHLCSYVFPVLSESKISDISFVPNIIVIVNRRQNTTVTQHKHPAYQMKYQSPFEPVCCFPRQKTIVVNWLFVIPEKQKLITPVCDKKECGCT